MNLFQVYLVLYCLTVRFVIADQCPPQILSNTGSNETGICRSDNCALSISGWDSYNSITLNILCPYSIAYCSKLYGSNHNISINCYKCQIDIKSCTYSSRDNYLYYDDEINNSTFNNSENCQCSAINQCQTTRTNNICLNTQIININWINDDRNDQFIQCQKKCYESQEVNCVYGIYYSYNGDYPKCYIITAGCNVYDNVNNKGQYYFVSEGCMSFANGSFHATPFPYNSETSTLNTWQIFTIIFGIIIIIVILAKIGDVFKKKYIYKTNKNKNILLKGNKMYKEGDKIMLPNGQIAVIQPVTKSVHKSIYRKSTNPLLEGRGTKYSNYNDNINELEGKWEEFEQSESALDMMNDLRADFKNIDDDREEKQVAEYEYILQFSILDISPHKNQPTSFNCIAFVTGFVLMNVLTDYNELNSLNIAIFWYIALFGTIFGGYLLYKHYLYYKRMLELRHEYMLDNKQEIHCFEEDINSAVLPKYLIFIEVPIRIIVRFVGFGQCILIPVNLFGMAFTVWVTFICCVMPTDPMKNISSMMTFWITFDFIPTYQS